MYLAHIHTYTDLIYSRCARVQLCPCYFAAQSYIYIYWCRTFFLFYFTHGYHWFWLQLKAERKRNKSLPSHFHFYRYIRTAIPIMMP
jgi:hypothetical protein